MELTNDICRITEKYNSKIVGKIRYDINIVTALINNKTIIEYPKLDITKDIINLWKEVNKEIKEISWKVAIPIVNGKLSDHFGHSEKFKFYYIEDGKVDKTEEVPSPPHQPGFLPEWLHEQGANIIITGGMGQKAKLLFDENGIEVFTGSKNL